ncbi:MAG: hypothetical protein Q8P56_02230 [Candidatus Uhrbacteria bacterium]|nr:hypothetical protein [Candidatus Uhrbacteria bacterium]
MLLSYLRSNYSHEIDEGWGAFEIGNHEMAEKHFRYVLQHEDDPHITVLDAVEAHNGLGAVSRAHKDFFDAWRWYKEAEYLLEQYYNRAWPGALSWSYPHDRPALRMLIGLGHTAYARGDTKTAQKYYKMIIDHDKKDELGIRHYMAGIARGKKFQFNHW